MWGLESAEKWREVRQALSTGLGPTEGGQPDKAWQAPTVGEAETHSEARTDLMGRVRGDPFSAAEPKVEVSGSVHGEGDGPASPLPATVASLGQPEPQWPSQRKRRK